MPARAALDMATIGGARALHMERLIGSLEPGKRADLITVSMRAARQTPMYDPVSHLVYATRGDDVRTTIVNGKVLMKDRQVRTLDRAAVIADANRLAAEVRDAVRPTTSGSQDQTADGQVDLSATTSHPRTAMCGRLRYCSA